MDKPALHHVWTRLRPIKPWYFVGVAAISGTVAVVALRDNNLEMARLRNVVYTADKNNGNVVGALQQLQLYVTAHMNTDLSGGPNAPYPPIQLQYTYDRAVQAAGASASAANAQIYTDAQHYCEKQDPVDFSGHNRVPCVQQYVQSHGVTLPSIPDSLYKFDFVSPVWSPDLAGWSLAVAVVALLLAASFWVVEWWFRRSSQ